jgi:hypothetical protein
MRILQTTFNELIFNPFMWSADWAWALPLIVLTRSCMSQGSVFDENSRVMKKNPDAIYGICFFEMRAAVVLTLGSADGVWGGSSYQKSASASGQRGPHRPRARDRLRVEALILPRFRWTVHLGSRRLGEAAAPWNDLGSAVVAEGA